MMKKIPYEEAMKKLEVIVGQLEGGELPLDDSLKLFEEGTQLVNMCNTYLETAQQKVYELTKSDED